MSFRKKLNRLKPHLSTEQEVKVEDTKNLNEIPFLEQWEAEGVSPYYYDNHYCFVREKVFPIDHQYGNYTFAQFYHAVQAWNNSTFQHPLSSKGFTEGQLFFFDTETTGLGGGVGNTIFLLGYASFQKDKVVLRQHFLPNPSGEVPLYQSFLENIDYTTLVTYNGKAFDWPQVKTRHILVREHVPKLPSFGHFDLFHAARRLWKHKLERLKLSIVEKEVLGVERVEDVPGFLAPMIYFDFVESGKPDGMIGILKHNEMDILSLITLYTHLTFQLLNIDAKRTTTEGYEVGRWYAALGDTHAATETLSMAANGDEKDSLKAKLALSYEWKKQKEWEKALLLWEELAEVSNKNIAIESCIELAKYLEHREKNFDEAKAYCEKAMTILQEKMKIWRTEKQPQLEELEKRQERLKRKSKKS
ncbi:ribonuclease H-like domain-containing protein [Robertmurraya kyonggiensis]|uniref:YprB ribonuclease H-like domain-containing protein n=1 Tax=Robertmurraya kyonggiensis TaxID=1037680 RepID=A0A4U1DC64_9BACI|nr:ribonuclease H-like domain-containing protein [Robertmurraya kyonggiensis]TKC19673.1 hypothetical protein FA727_09110 [Robertmurraya kyonggiensis]